MNMLIDALPSCVRVAGALHPIRTDYRIYIMFEQLLSDDELGKDERIESAVELCYEHPEALPDNIDEIVNALLWFYRCGKPEDKRLLKRAEKRREAQQEAPRIYDYDQDAEYIYAAFLEQYGVDLCDIDGLHWWKYHAMLHALREDCLFVKIMGYRSVNLSKITDKKERNRIAQQQALYKLRNGKSEEEKAALLYDPDTAY